MTDRVVAMLEKELKPHAFAKTGSTPGKPDGTGRTFTFVRKLPEGAQFIQLTTGSLRYDGLTVLFSIGGQNDLVHPVLWKALPELEAGGLPNQPFAEDYFIHFPHTAKFEEWSRSDLFMQNWPDNWMGNKFSVQPGGGAFAKEAVNALLNTLVSACVPILDVIGTLRGIQRAFIHGVGQIVDVQVAAGARNTHTAIVAGYLLRDPDLKQFVNEAVSRVQSNSWTEETKKSHTETINRLVAYLETNVEPLQE